MEELESLLAQGHGVNSSDEIGWTALHEAALNNIDTRACRLLLDHGANVGAANSYGETPAGTARSQGSVQVAHAGLFAPLKEHK